MKRPRLGTVAHKFLSVSTDAVRYFNCTQNASVSSPQWSSKSVHSICASTRKSGNHVCRPDVCHKGSVGKKGFCRMRYWHWARFTDTKGNAAARRSHGIELRPRWNGTRTLPHHGSAPLTGAPALETTHPFHFKMTPGAMLGPRCNHDLGMVPKLSLIHI